MKCLRCGHEPCPFCKDWCDVVSNDGDLCCDGQCVYDCFLESVYGDECGDCGQEPGTNQSCGFCNNIIIRKKPTHHLLLSKRFYLQDPDSALDKIWDLARKAFGPLSTEGHDRHINLACITTAFGLAVDHYTRCQYTCFFS